ncbi:MAG: hypothetical protein FWE31_03920 [Firmicutes bacterium]|nr:hypothetical protein [Bacillota bacterium]
MKEKLEVFAKLWEAAEGTKQERKAGRADAKFLGLRDGYLCGLGIEGVPNFWDYLMAGSSGEFASEREDTDRFTSPYLGGFHTQYLLSKIHGRADASVARKGRIEDFETEALKYAAVTKLKFGCHDKCCDPQPELLPEV